MTATLTNTLKKIPILTVIHRNTPCGNTCQKDKKLQQIQITLTINTTNKEMQLLYDGVTILNYLTNHNVLRFSKISETHI
jgi:hypothetical protein